MAPVPSRSSGTLLLSPPDPILGSNGGAVGESSATILHGQSSAPNSDHPASTSLGVLIGMGVANPHEYFKRRTIVIYLIDPSISRASFFDTFTDSGSGTFAGCIPGLTAAPFSCKAQVIVNEYLKQN